MNSKMHFIISPPILQEYDNSCILSQLERDSLDTDIWRQLRCLERYYPERAKEWILNYKKKFSFTKHQEISIPVKNKYEFISRGESHKYTKSYRHVQVSDFLLFELGCTKQEKIDATKSLEQKLLTELKDWAILNKIVGNIFISNRKNLNHRIQITAEIRFPDIYPKELYENLQTMQERNVKSEVKVL